MKKKWVKWLLIILLIPIILFIAGITLVYAYQEQIVQSVLKSANEDFQGEITLKGSHIAPFANFPYISIDLEELRVFESKDTTERAVLSINDVYLGFDIWTIISGNLEVKSVKISDGDIYIVEYPDGEFNITKAFALKEEKEVDDVKEDFHFDLQSLVISNVDIHKTNPNNLEFSVYCSNLDLGFRSKKDHLFLRTDIEFQLTMIEKGDTSFINKKLFRIRTELDYSKEEELLIVPPSTIRVADVNFEFEGIIDIYDDLNLDLKFNGTKPDFSLLIALAPDEVIPVLKAFENRGDVFFNTTVQGKSVLGNVPAVNAEFGCKNGYFKNTSSVRVLDELSFVGVFTNGEERTLESMRFELRDFNARPETGLLSLNVVMENFESPDIDVQVKTIFDLDYLAQFLNVEQLERLEGKVELEMNFHDIIDLKNPEKSIEKFNEAYFTKLKVDKLGFTIPGYKERFEDINVRLNIDGNSASLDRFILKVGGSDLAIAGAVSDLPAIIHHTNTPVSSRFKITSNALDINELTLARGDVVVEEYIRDFEMDFEFLSSAKALTEFPYLPVGDFKLSKLNAKLTNYPHALKNFTADFHIDTTFMLINDFSGKIDESDIHLKAAINNYPLWFQDSLNGDTKIGIDITSNLLQFKDIFSFDGENYVPEDYRDEELRNLKAHLDAELHFFGGSLESSDVYITELTAKANMHAMEFERFAGRIHIEDDHFTAEKFRGTIGNTSFTTDINYYFGDDVSLKRRKNKLVFRSPRLDFDQLFDYQAPPSTNDPNAAPVDHDSVFSLFDIPFPDMSYNVKIGKMNYHNYLITNINADLRTTTTHKLYVDTLQMDIVGGHIDLSGYFTGEDRSNIYFSPILQIDNINLDKLMLKFDNFGQDEVLSDQLHGIVSGKIWGKIHMHADLVPILDDSEIYIDVDIVGGSIENYGPLEALSGFFEDDKLHKVLFDTLQNQLNLVNGVMTVPEMVINTNLGFIKVSGKQNMSDDTMEYYLRVPLRMITSVGSNKLFGGRKDGKNPEDLSDFDPNKKYRFVNIKIVGDAEDFKVSLGKNKSK